jgi:hypothetical protein
MICDLPGMMHAVEEIRREEIGEKDRQNALTTPSEDPLWLVFRNLVADMLLNLADRVRPKQSGLPQPLHPIK